MVHVILEHNMKAGSNKIFGEKIVTLRECVTVNMLLYNVSYKYTYTIPVLSPDYINTIL